MNKHFTVRYTGPDMVDLVSGKIYEAFVPNDDDSYFAVKDEDGMDDNSYYAYPKELFDILKEKPRKN
jgi:hypothetical protein